MPVTIGIFLNPGTIPGSGPGKKARQNRSFEYDRLSDQYALFHEKNPHPKSPRSTTSARTPMAEPCGISLAASVPSRPAWTRPDLFSKVLSHVGSFHQYPRRRCYPEPDPQT